MGYVFGGTVDPTSKRWLNSDQNAGVGQLASASRAVGSGSGASFDVSTVDVFKALLRITGPSDGNINVRLEGSNDGGTTWETIESWPNKSARWSDVHGRRFEVRHFALARWAWSVAGASVTFGIDPAKFINR